MSDGSRNEEAGEKFKYWAFISYSGTDKGWVKWLHQNLETYRVPKELVGRSSRGCVIPRRLFPIFYDREELSASSDLSQAIREAIRRSRYLIVICSPRAALSRWVNDEVRLFKQLGRSGRLLCLVTDGEPNATDSPGLGLLECFPPAVRYGVNEEGLLTDERITPLFADVRRRGDGRVGAKLKLLAGILGEEGLDLIKQRERRRRTAAWCTRAAIFVLVIGVIAVICLSAQKRRHADQARYHRDQLIEEGRQELLRGDPTKALPLLSAAYSAGATDMALRFMLAEALRPTQALELRMQSAGKEQILWAHVPPDGAHLLTAHADKTVRLVEISTGRELSRFTALGETRDVFGFSPDGQRMVATRDRKATIWKVHDATVEHVLRGHDLTIRAVAFSPDGNLLATASADNTAAIWDLRSGERAHVLQGHTATVTAVTFSPDGRTLATGGVDESVKLWSVQKGVLTRSLDDQGATVDRLAYSRNGARLAVFNRDSRVMVWDVHSARLLCQSPPGLIVRAADLDHATSEAVAAVTGKQGATSWLLDLLTGQKLGDLRGQLTSADFSPDGRQILCGSWGQRAVELSDASTGRRLLSLQPSQSLSPLATMMRQAEFDESGSRAITLSDTGDLRLWRIATTLPFEIGIQAEFPTGAFFDHSGQNVVIAFPHAAVVSDAHTRARLASWSTESFSVKQVGFNNREQRLAIAASDGAVHIWNLRTSTYETSLPGRTVQLSPDGRTGVIARADGSTALFDPSSGKISCALSPAIAEATKHLAVPDERGIHLEFSEDGQQVLTANGREGTKVFSVRDGRLLWNAAGQSDIDLAYAAHFSPDGRQVLAVGRFGGDLWDLPKNRLIIHLVPPPLFGIIRAGFSRGGQRLYSAGGDGIVKIWSAENGALESTFDCEGNFVGSVSFHPGGELLATANSDGKIQIWSLANARPLSTFEGWHAEFSPDGETLLLGGRTMKSLSFRLENRSATSVAAIAAENSPWRLDGDHLVTFQRASTPPPATRLPPAPQSPSPATSPP